MPYRAPFAFLLASVYAFSAVQKARDLPSFADYLRPLAGSYSHQLGVVIVAIECLLSTVLILTAANNSVATAASIASLIFLSLATLFYSVLLGIGGSTECHCFGGARRDRVNPAIKPALFALRTSILIACSVSIQGIDRHVIAQITLLGVTAIMIGLLGSVTRELLMLRRPNHPRVQEFADRILRLQAHSWWVNGHPRSW